MDAADLRKRERCIILQVLTKAKSVKRIKNRILYR